MKLPDELDTGGKWELVFHRLQIAEEDLASEIFPKTMDIWMMPIVKNIQNFFK